jgi:hypothetical protein
MKDESDSGPLAAMVLLILPPSSFSLSDCAVKRANNRNQRSRLSLAAGPCGETGCGRSGDGGSVCEHRRAGRPQRGNAAYTASEVRAVRPQYRAAGDSHDGVSAARGIGKAERRPAAAAVAGRPSAAGHRSARAVAAGARVHGPRAAGRPARSAIRVADAAAIHTTAVHARLGFCGCEERLPLRRTEAKRSEHDDHTAPRGKFNDPIKTCDAVRPQENATLLAV